MTGTERCWMPMRFLLNWKKNGALKRRLEIDEKVETYHLSVG